MVVISCKLQFFLKLHLIAFKNSLSSPTFKVKNLAFIDFHQILQQKCIKNISPKSLKITIRTKMFAKYSKN